MPVTHDSTLNFEEFGSAMVRAFNAVHSRTRHLFLPIGDIRAAAQPILRLAKANKLSSPMDLALIANPPFLTDQLADILTPLAEEAVSLATANLFEANIQFGRGGIDAWLNEQRLHNIMERSRVAENWEPGTFHGSPVWTTSISSSSGGIPPGKRTPSTRMLASAEKA